MEMVVRFMRVDKSNGGFWQNWGEGAVVGGLSTERIRNSAMLHPNSFGGARNKWVKIKGYKRSHCKGKHKKRE